MVDKRTMLQWLHELTAARGFNTQDAVASFAVYDDKKKLMLRERSTYCNQSMSRVEGNPAYIVSLNNLGYSSKSTYGDWVNVWNRWVVERSPFREAFVSPCSMSPFGYVLRANVPGNYLIAAIQMTRQSWDGAAIPMGHFWLDLYHRGINPWLAHIACCCIIPEKKIDGVSFKITDTQYNDHVNTNHVPLSPYETVDHRKVVALANETKLLGVKYRSPDYSDKPSLMNQYKTADLWVCEGGGPNLYKYLKSRALALLPKEEIKCQYSGRVSEVGTGVNKATMLDFLATALKEYQRG